MYGTARQVPETKEMAKVQNEVCTNQRSWLEANKSSQLQSLRYRAKSLFSEKNDDKWQIG